MTTTEQLRDALTADAEAAATPGHLAAVRRRLALTGDDLTVVEAPSRRRRRLRLVLSAGVVAVVAATVVTLFVALRPGATTTTPVAAPTALPPRWQFSVDPDPGGLTFGFGDATRSLQTGLWFGSGSARATAMLQVSAAPTGRPVPARSAPATDLQIAGTAGWTRPIPQVVTDAQGTGPFAGLEQLFVGGTLAVWTDATTGLTASLQAPASVSLDRIVQLASTVHVGATRPIMVPFKATYVPQSGVVPWKSVTAPLPPESANTPPQFALGDDGLGFFEFDVAPVGAFQFPDDTRYPRTDPTRIGRWQVTYRPGSLSTLLTDGRVDVSISWGDASRTQQLPESSIPVDELIRFVDGLTVADLADPTTWFDFSQTIPS